ncbi:MULTISPECIES: hypothetical protein [Candidatus Ichthyocystis]|nr:MULTISPECIES: hypothetical protein [Ichthyocystis]
MNIRRPIYFIWYDRDSSSISRSIVVGVYYVTRLCLLRLEISSDNYTLE